MLAISGRHDTRSLAAGYARRMREASELADVETLLGAHALAAVRLIRADAAEVVLEVFHCEWPKTVFGRLRFRDVVYLCLPTTTTWGLHARVAEPSVIGLDAIDLDGARVFELYVADANEPSVFVAARALACEPWPA
jgi:hypothetical protein